MRDYSRDDAPVDVRITGLETAVIEGNFDWNYVRIHTDAGVSGLGESYRGSSITDIMREMKPILEGENPMDVERLFRRMIQETSGHGGTTGKVITAASGIEIALWDIVGKVTELPVYQLLGGKYRDRIRLYVDCHAGRGYETDETGYAVEHEEEVYAPESYADVAREVVDRGFSALKFDLDTPMDNHPDPVNGRVSNASLTHKRNVVAAVRDAVGPDIDIAFDCHWDYSLDSAKRLARSLEPYDLMWLEDLVPPENMEIQRTIARATQTPLATGENRFRVHEFKTLLYEQAVDIITPDPTTCGGIAESKAIASRAEENYIVMSPHNVCSPIGTIACVHLGAAIPNHGVLEYHAKDVPWWDDLLARGPSIENGSLTVPEDPGLGIELDEAVAREHQKGSGELWTAA